MDVLRTYHVERSTMFAACCAGYVKVAMHNLTSANPELVNLVEPLPWR